ncbi:YARHG domain-containing protein [Methylorubrum populi]
MNRSILSRFVCLSLALAALPATAQERPFTPSLTCGAVKALVARERRVVLATSPTAYETVHFESGACTNEVTAAPAFEPTLDDRYCFAGYRCVQRNNGENSVR